MQRRRSHARGRVFQVELLEDRQLLATTIGGTTPSVVVIRRSLADLQSQLTSGPLADLSSGAVAGDGFITEVQSVTSSWQQGVDQKFGHFKAIDNLLTLQGQRVVADLVSLNEQSFVGMYDSNAQAMVSGAAINSLTSGPIYSLNTPVDTNISTTQVFEENLAALARTLSSSAKNPLTITDVSNTLQAEAESYRADMHAALQVSHSAISSKIDAAVNTLEATVKTIAASNSSTAQAGVNKAIATFDTTILGVSGLFSMRGPVNRVNSARGFVPHNLSTRSAASTLENVSGTATVGGVATLTATLKSSGKPVSDVVVSFTLDGAFAGTALTSGSGIATLTGVPTSDSAGTVSRAIVATFAGNASHQPTSNSGDLVVGQSSTALASVSGTASIGGTANLKATLTSTASGAGVSGQTVDFTLDGKSVGSATTDSSGIATLSGVATTDAVGTHAGAVVASFAGVSDYKASTGTGDLVVGAAATSFSGISGTASYQGTATLTATLKSSVTGQPISGATLNFSLAGTSVGTAVTNSSGVATLLGVNNTYGVGTQTGAVAVSYAATTNYLASSGTGNLVVSAAATTMGSVSGNAVQGGSATLTATLTSSVTGKPIANQSISFTLNGTTAGAATTNSSGVAILTGVATSQAVGTYPGAVVAAFTAPTGSSYLTTSGTGSLVVSSVGSTITLVSGTASFGGSATLTATLSSGGTGISGKTVNFTLDGTSVGSAVTDSNGIATLPGVTTSDAVGTHTGVVVASFAGDTSYGASSGSGDLVVSQAGATLASISGNAVQGGTATLRAMLTSSVTNLGISGETVNFTLGGTSAGSAVTDSNGIATLTGVATSDPVGSYAGVVSASFAGDTNYTSTTGSGDLTVSSAASSLSSVSGTANFGGTATLTATLTSNGAGVLGKTVNFVLNGKSLGTAATGSNGVATLSGVTTTSAAGTYNSVVVASFAGDTSYGASAGTGNLVVSQAGTTLATVTGTASFGGTATLSATLNSNVTGLPISGEVVHFTLDGKSVGTATTSTNGRATLSNVTTADGVGTHTGVVVASFAGDSNYLSSSGSGDLVVSQAGSTLATVSGSSTYGGKATLTATLTSSVTSQPIANETVDFTLNGTSVGTAVTNSSGIASLTGVTTTDSAGTHTGAVGASFAGDTNYLASNGTGDLVVSQAATTLGSVSGSGSSASGGTVTLVATLTSNVTGQPITGETVSFLLGTNTTPVGTVATDGSGIATLSGLSNSGLTSGETVTALYSGSANYLGAGNATGTLTLS